MKSLNPEYILKQPITHNLLQTIRRIGEYKGKQDLYKEQSPQVLETLRQAAVIQSTESSNRLEGITAPQERIRELVARKTTPRNRSEQEITGYRDVLRVCLKPRVMLGLAGSYFRSIRSFWAGNTPGPPHDKETAAILSLGPSFLGFNISAFMV